MGAGPSTERDGLFTLTPAGFNGDAKYNIDIVAVHGLGGHWLGTWKAKNGACWLEEFLPAQFETARVMSFGYDSDIAFSSNVTDITDIAKMLLERLRGERQSDEEKKRPIVFISHSLGGIVVKKALIEARRDLPRYSDLLGSVCGLVFFGVPHCGSDAASWAYFAAKLSKLLLFGRANRKFVQALVRDSGILAEISQQFIEQDSDIKIRTFYETKRMSNHLIVDKASACLGLPNEAAVGIGSANHSDMCKFEDPLSQKYLPVKNAMAELVEHGIRRASQAASPKLQWPGWGIGSKEAAIEENSFMPPNPPSSEEGIFMPSHPDNEEPVFRPPHHPRSQTFPMFPDHSGHEGAFGTPPDYSHSQTFPTPSDYPVSVGTISMPNLPDNEEANFTPPNHPRSQTFPMAPGHSGHSGLEGTFGTPPNYPRSQALPMPSDHGGEVAFSAPNYPHSQTSPMPPNHPGGEEAFLMLHDHPGNFSGSPPVWALPFEHLTPAYQY